MDMAFVQARAGEIGAAIRCVTHMQPQDRPIGGLVGECAVLVEPNGDGLAAMRHDFRAEGMSPRRVKVDAGKAGLGRLDDFLGRIARLQARERAIVGHGVADVVYPSWAFSADALALEIAGADGVDLAQCSKPAKQSRVFERQFGRVATPEEAWQWSRTNHAVSSYSDQNRPGGLRGFEAEMKGDRLAMRVLSPAGRNVTLREEPGGTWLVLWSTTLPDTVLMGLKGRRLSQVVEGLGDGHEIVKAENREDAAWLKVRGPRVPLAPAPEGIDMGWMEL